MWFQLRGRAANFVMFRIPRLVPRALFLLSSRIDDEEGAVKLCDKRPKKKHWNPMAFRNLGILKSNAIVDRRQMDRVWDARMAQRNLSGLYLMRNSKKPVIWHNSFRFQRNVKWEALRIWFGWTVKQSSLSKLLSLRMNAQDKRNQFMMICWLTRILNEGGGTVLSSGSQN